MIFAGTSRLIMFFAFLNSNYFLQGSRFIVNAVYAGYVVWQCFFYFLLRSGNLPILDPDRYGLGTDALSTRGILYGHAGDAKMTPDEITSYLKKVYCNTMALDLLCVEVCR